MQRSKIDVQNLYQADNLRSMLILRTLASLVAAGVFLLPNFGCVMTRAQGDKLAAQVHDLESEVAKLQRVRHDMETLMVGQVRDLIDRIAKLENQLNTFRETLSEGSSKNSELVAELQSLRGELEEAQLRYRALQQDQQDLAKHQLALKEAHKKLNVPPIKEDHFALAKKYLAGKKYDEAIQLFDQFIRDYPNDKDLGGQAHFQMGEAYREHGKAAASTEDTEKYYKKAVMAYQKVIEMHKSSVLREESLFKIGMVLKAMGNKEGAAAAFNELITKHGKGKRALEAKGMLADLDKK